MNGIALLVPCYHAAVYLPRLMESVAAQTAPFAEIILYDDGSKDDTIEVARRLGLRIIAGETNRGPAYARNRLREAASAPWLHYHDADDLLMPDFVARMSGLIAADVDIIVCDMDWITETTRTLEVAWRYDDSALRADPVAANLVNPVGVIACVFRRQVLDAVAGFDETLATWEDADLQVRLSHRGARYRAVAEVLAIGLRHTRGASSDTRAMAECRLRLLERYVAALPGRYRPILGEQAERLAGRLLVEKQHRDIAERALALCQTLDWPVPTTRNPLLRAARILLPIAWVLAWQVRHRDRAALRAAG